MTKQEKIVLLILDGWGYREEKDHNAIAQAHTPNYDRLWRDYPHAVLEAAGTSVGLPEGQMGTSEVNHMVIGAGRVVFQDLVKIDQAIKKDNMASNEAIMKALEHVKKQQSCLHLQGLVSSGGVHSHQEHFYALLSLAKRVGVPRVAVHVFTDGRDTPPKSALKYVRELQDFMDKLGLGRIASVTGRYWAMDRDSNLERTEAAFAAITKGEGRKYPSVLQAIEDAYDRQETDEFIKPSVIEMEPGEEGCVSSNDAVIFVNFRSDRAIQLSQKFLESDIANLDYVTMSQYRKEFNCRVAFPPEKVENTLGEVISRAGLRQLRVTETEKFNHLTYFLNCKKMKALEGEDRMMLDSYSDIATHDERPQMRTPDIAREIVQDIKAGTHEVIFANLCNGDMIGHTAKIKAVKKGVETIDQALGQITQAGLTKDYHIIITADHGNAEEVLDQQSGQPMTSHTINPVPFIVVSNKYHNLKKTAGELQDIAPTSLKILGQPQPIEMTGESLVE
ncbi:2,3-bisphosphoglycerate-independent phosphoglycerate mutase [Patescibacteria group bacterium]|nr:2,3-bisphosphoglycerate-independent phosphoglycerate mutase [Patescibacteria group bacterium]